MRPGHAASVDTPPRPATSTPRKRPTWTPRSHAARFIGRSLDGGRFLIRSLIAQGGMSDVFLADDRKDGRPVAIKILRTDDVDTGEGRRFIREARVLANLQHPNLVAVLATGETEDGNPYMVQPYLGGDTLRARLAGGPLGWRIVLEIGAQIADVLHALHEAGVVHRDVKIDNIIWARHPTQPVWVQLIDLGIAKLLGFVPPPIEGVQPLDQRATGIGYVLGTDGYRPPEALEGICTPRFDVYSLGVTLYRLCANVMPHSHDVRPLAEVCPGWDGPADFEAAIRKAMDPDPERRFASAEALRLTLEAIRTCNPDPDRPRHLFAGRYDLLGPLGSGAKATTYRAYHRELEATLAIKILSTKAQADPDECLRFVREAMILRHVRHPNLPAFYGLDTYAGQRYIAMELCPGRRAREYTLAGTCLRPREVLCIGEQLASALHALHEAGVIYRDLSWDNVLIHFDDRDRDPTVKLIDFNASLLIEDRFYARLDERWARPPEQRERPSRDLQLTRKDYAAPEVRAGAPWSERSDVFALGRLLYLLLTGQAPFQGEPNGPMPPPWRKDCPLNLIAALEAALEVDPERRGTLDTVLEALADARKEIEEDEKAVLLAAHQARQGTQTPTREPAAHDEPAAASAEQGPAVAPEETAVVAADAPSSPGPTATSPDLVDIPRPETAAAEPSVQARRWWLAALAAIVIAAIFAVQASWSGHTTSTQTPVGPPSHAEPTKPRIEPAAEPAKAPEEVALDMDSALARAAGSLGACARGAGRRISVELTVNAGGARFASITVLPADASVECCVREILEPVRFRSQPTATTLMTEYRP